MGFRIGIDIFLNEINRFIFVVMQTQQIFCEVGPEGLNIIQMNFRLQSVSVSVIMRDKHYFIVAFKEEFLASLSDS
jgi:hypothetical protein